MFKPNKTERQKAALYKLLHNGNRFAVLDATGNIVRAYRYELDARRTARPGQSVRPLSDLIDELGQTPN
ncbi:hypothetical protein IIF17_004306 [Salmonella enterica]|mgnify:CR=1 FL=1|jgi:hypothetical protein|nr:hypothetical protein [Salmonella enterica]